MFAVTPADHPWRPLRRTATALARARCSDRHLRESSGAIRLGYGKNRSRARGVGLPAPQHLQRRLAPDDGVTASAIRWADFGSQWYGEPGRPQSPDVGSVARSRHAVLRELGPTTPPAAEGPSLPTARNSCEPSSRSSFQGVASHTGRRTDTNSRRTLKCVLAIVRIRANSTRAFAGFDACDANLAERPGCNGLASRPVGPWPPSSTPVLHTTLLGKAGPLSRTP
jgi:hypothetical protein